MTIAPLQYWCKKLAASLVKHVSYGRLVIVDFNRQGLSFYGQLPRGFWARVRVFV
jgi:hypothetical protein